ncbi:MAG: tyrosine-type recombinase/integrase [Chthoniobacteraceae bacterium]
MKWLNLQRDTKTFRLDFATYLLHYYGVILSSYERARSPFVHVQWALKPEDKKTYEKTKIRKDDPDKERKIALYLAELRVKLLRGDVVSANSDGGISDVGWGWVKNWIEVTHKNVSGTAGTYVRHWRNIVPFLVEHKIPAPAFIQREHATKYIAWRTGQTKQKSKKNPSQNTALQEIKTLARILDEAISREMTEHNPLRKLGIGQEDSEPKPEITDAQQAVIEAALEKQPAWMSRSFALAIRTGLRDRTTRLHRNQVDVAGKRIVIDRPKGGKKRGFAIPLTLVVREVLQPWLDSGEPYFWNRPKEPNTPRGVIWRKFFNSLGLSDYCFHCTRVTYITRGARSGVPQSVMMKLVNHADSEIHRIYQRFSSADLQHWAEKIPTQTSAVSTLDNHPMQSGRTG